MVVLERDAAAVSWTEDVPEVTAVVGSADDLSSAQGAARAAQDLGTLTAWVNNAAVFRDAVLPDDPELVLDLVRTNLHRPSSARQSPSRRSVTRAVQDPS